MHRVQLFWILTMVYSNSRDGNSVQAPFQAKTSPTMFCMVVLSPFARPKTVGFPFHCFKRQIQPLKHHGDFYSQMMVNVHNFNHDY